MPNLLSLTLFLFFALPGYSQEEEIKQPLSDQGGQVIVRETAPESVDQSKTAPVVPAEDADLAELERVRAEKLKQMQIIQKSTETLKNPVGNPMEELQKLGHKQIDAVALMDKKVVALLQKVLKEADFSKMTPEVVREMINQKVKGHFMEDVLKTFPKLLDIAVDFVRSKEAMSGMLGIFARKEDLKTFGYTWLAIFVFAALVKRRIIKPKWNFFRRMRWSLAISVILTGVSLTVFYQLFSVEISPTVEILQKHLF